MAGRRAVSLLEGFRLLVDPLGRLRDLPARTADADPVAGLSVDLQMMHDVAVALTESSMPAQEPESEPRWRALMWGHHEDTTASEADFVHRMHVTDYTQAPQIMRRLDSVAPEPLLIDFAGMDPVTLSRMIDFLAGVSYGRRGQLFRVAEAAFAVLVEPQAPDAPDAPPTVTTGQLPLIGDDRIESAG